MLPDQDPFDVKLDLIEQRAKRLFAMLVSLAGALALTIISVMAAWHQVIDAQKAAEVNAKKIVDQEVHLAVTDDRVNRDGAPPPDPVVAVAARQAAEDNTQKETP